MTRCIAVIHSSRAEGISSSISHENRLLSLFEYYSLISDMQHGHGRPAYRSLYDVSLHLQPKFGGGWNLLSCAKFADPIANLFLLSSDQPARVVDCDPAQKSKPPREAVYRRCKNSIPLSAWTKGRCHWNTLRRFLLPEKGKLTFRAQTNFQLSPRGSANLFRFADLSRLLLL